VTIDNLEKSLISVKHLQKKFGEMKALSDINTEIKKGEVVVVIGPSGSGKSTLMNILGCLDRPTDGHYYLDGIEVGKLSENKLSLVRNKKIGFVFQSFHLIPRTSAMKNVELPMIYGKVATRKRHQRAKELLCKVGLEKRLNHLPQELSGGQRQRVAIARALVNQPAILMADEPTGNLDPKNSMEVMQILEQVNQRGITILVSTHDHAIVNHFRKRVITLEKGQIIKDVQAGTYD